MSLLHFPRRFIALWLIHWLSDVRHREIFSSNLWHRVNAIANMTNMHRRLFDWMIAVVQQMIERNFTCNVYWRKLFETLDCSLVKFYWSERINVLLSIESTSKAICSFVECLLRSLARSPLLDRSIQSNKRNLKIAPTNRTRRELWKYFQAIYFYGSLFRLVARSQSLILFAHIYF